MRNGAGRGNRTLIFRLMGYSGFKWLITRWKWCNHFIRYRTYRTMASLYKDTRSPFWQLQFINVAGKRCVKSTGLRHADPKETAKARVLAAQTAASELDRGECTRGTGGDQWVWVNKFLQDHCSKDTIRGYKNRWDWLSLFLAEMKIRTPGAVSYHHGQEYIDWRVGFRKKTGHHVCRNTAIYEVKLLSLIMQQAVRLGFCQGNPLTRLGIKKDAPAEKAEISDAEFKIVLKALPGEEEWMRVSWMISMHTGCRLSETIIPMHCIDFQRGTITFPDPKGGKTRAFSVPMPSALRPLFEDLRDRGQKVTCTHPFQPSRQWQHFFKRVKLEHLTFHCLRVTFVTRLARQGVPLSAAMRLTNHSSELIHRVYQRLGVEDVRNYADALFAPAENDQPTNAQKTV